MCAGRHGVSAGERLGAAQVTAVFRHVVKPGSETKFQRWVFRVATFLKDTQPGYIGTDVLSPQDGSMRCVRRHSGRFPPCHGHAPRSFYDCASRAVWLWVGCAWDVVCGGAASHGRPIWCGWYPVPCPPRYVVIMRFDTLEHVERVVGVRGSEAAACGGRGGDGGRMGGGSEEPGGTGGRHRAPDRHGHPHHTQRHAKDATIPAEGHHTHPVQCKDGVLACAGGRGPCACACVSLFASCAVPPSSFPV